MKYHITHKRFNDILSVIVVFVALYLVAAPFLPAAKWKLAPPSIQKSTPSAGAPIPQQSLLKIPRLGMDQPINTGETEAELSKGVWLIPHTSTPDQKSNTVMAGHRFTYAGPAVFYFLDKVQTHDKIYIDWQHREYTYQVKQIKVVPPTELSIQSATSRPTLTLYTCTPLITAKNRLVIVSELIGVRS